MKKGLCCIFLFLLITGCSRYVEVNELGIVEVFAVTKKQEIRESVTMILPQKQKNTYEFLTKEGTSLGNALIHLQNAEEKKVYFDQAQILLLNPTILKEEISNLIPFLLDHFRHPNWLTFLCDDCETILQKEKAKSFYENLIRKEKNRSGYASITTFEDVASFYLEETMTAYLPYLSIKDNTVVLEKWMAFTSNKRLIPFSLEEAKTLFLLKEKGKTFEENITLQQKKLSYSLSNIDTKITLKKGDVLIHVSGYYTSNDEGEKQEKQAKKELEKQLLKQIQAFIQKERDEKTDLLGIYHLFYRAERDKEKAKEKMEQASYQIKVALKKEGDIN